MEDKVLFNRRSHTVHSTTPTERCNTDDARASGNLKEVTLTELSEKGTRTKLCAYCFGAEE